MLFILESVRQGLLSVLRKPCRKASYFAVATCVGFDMERDFGACSEICGIRCIPRFKGRGAQDAARGKSFPFAGCYGVGRKLRVFGACRFAFAFIVIKRVCQNIAGTSRQAPRQSGGVRFKACLKNAARECCAVRAAIWRRAKTCPSSGAQNGNRRELKMGGSAKSIRGRRFRRPSKAPLSRRDRAVPAGIYAP